MSYHFRSFGDDSNPHRRAVEAIRRLVIDHGKSWIEAVRIVMHREDDETTLALIADHLERRERRKNLH